jgi:hypothetical protein
MKYYWEDAVRNWGSGVRREYWTRQDHDLHWRLRSELYAALARYV